MCSQEGFGCGFKHRSSSLSGNKEGFCCRQIVCIVFKVGTWAVHTCSTQTYDAFQLFFFFFLPVIENRTDFEMCYKIHDKRAGR